MTVNELIAQLQTMEPTSEVRVWLPGSQIELSGAFPHNRELTLIEGNIIPGSALDDRPSGQAEPQ